MNPTPSETYVENAITESGVRAVRLEPRVADGLRGRLKERYTGTKLEPMWERLKDEVTRRRVDGWSKATEFVGSSQTILLLDQLDGQTMWQFANGSDVRRVLENSPHFDFYLTDADAAYLICCNHHDLLIGSGSCKSWLSALSDD